MKYLRIIIILLIFTIPITVFSQERGIKIVAIDNATNKWQEISLYNKTHAVIIGIDKYPRLSSEQQLTYAVSDAKAVERMLKDKFVFNNIYSLYNEQATKSNIEDILLNKLSKISKDDAVFVFFAGHGGQEKTDYGDIGYILPYDSDFRDMRKVISMSTIRDDISKRIKAKHVFFVMDACYSGLLVVKRGEISKETKRDITYLKQITKEPVRQVLTAGDANQQVLDGGPNGHSVFTGRFLEILDSAEDFITAEEISARVKEMVFSDANARGHIQTPKSGTLFGLGDFIFMPSLTKKQGNIKQQISDLENELKRIEEFEKLAQEQENEAEKRELERQRKTAESQLQTKKLEEQRLEKERIQREQQEQERQRRISEQKIKQEKETQRLEALKEQVEEKRKTYKSSMILSLDQALAELQFLDKQIKEIKTSYLEELKKRIMSIAETHSNNYSFSALLKDEFETEAEFKQRLFTQSGNLKSSNQQEFSRAMETIKTAFDEQVAPLLTQVEDISNNSYTIYGHDALKIKLGDYNADKESFSITVASNNIKRDIYPQGRVIIVSEVSGQARIIGIREGDILISYNNIIIKPGVNWSELKQTVITDNVMMKIDRNGKLIKFTLQKGNIGIETYIDDYVKDLKSNQFIINCELHVPRTVARSFKQNYLNGFITAELKVKPINHLMSLVTNAIIVDESNDSRYDLFESRFLYLGNKLISDTENDLIWLTYYPKILNWQGVNKYVNNYVYKGMKGWQIPTFNQIKSIKKTSAFYNFNFGSRYFYTSTLDKHNRRIQYKPSSGNTDADDSDREYFLLNNSLQHKNNEINIFMNRFIKLNEDLVFDAENKLIWFIEPITEIKYTSLESEKFIKKFNYKNLKGWRLPTYYEFKSLYDYSIPGISNIFNFGSRYFYTSTLDKHNRRIQYKPSSGNTDADDSDREYVVGVM